MSTLFSLYCVCFVFKRGACMYKEDFVCGQSESCAYGGSVVP